MMRRLSFGLVLLLATAGRPAVAQDPAQVAVAVQKPRFVAAWPAPGKVIDASDAAVLQRRVSVDMTGRPLGDVLREVARQARVDLVYDPEHLPPGHTVSLHVRAITVLAALTEVLAGTRLDVVVRPTGQLTIVPAEVVDGAVRRLAPGTITGRVTDAATGQPIAGADVFLDGTDRRTTSGEQGEFRLAEVPPGGYTMVVRRIGYAASRRPVTVGDGESLELAIALTSQPTRLDELVTTVTGDQRRLEVGNTVVSLDADSLMRTAPVTSMNDLLQGRAPGVLSLPEGGVSGQAGRIRIRGLNSALVSNDPVVIVDGVRVEAGAATRDANATGSNPGGYTGRLADLDPDEIATVEIVKGPSASTLYGTDAANGVIVITTKRGQEGKTRWTAFSEQGLLHRGLDLTDNFPAGWYAFGRSSATDEPVRCTLLERVGGSCVFDSLATFNTFTDPETTPFKDSHRQQYGLQVSGGTAGGATYFLSGDYEEETGPAFMPWVDRALIRTTQGREVPDWQARPNAYERLNLRANLTAPLGRRGSATLATGFVSNQARSPSSFVFGTSPQVGYRDSNDGWLIADGINPRPAHSFPFRAEDVVRRFLGSLSATYSMRDWLALRGTVGADLSTNAYGRIARRGESPDGGVFKGDGFRQANELSVARYSLDLGATATRALSAAVTSKTSVGVQYNRRSQRGATLAVNNLPLGGETIAGGTIVPFLPLAEATLATAVAGGYVEQMFGFRDRLFLTGALRLDGGSAFGQDFAVTAYPKAHLSWLVTDGQAGPRLPGVGSLRLRAAYGASGVQPGPFDALTRVMVESGLTVDGTATGPGGFLAAGNPGLKPERSSELEAGLDLELWQNRVRLEFTAYQRTSDDALFSRPFAPSAAMNLGESHIENLGSVRNRGLELLLSADLVRSRWLAAGFTATGALNQNRLRRLGAGVIPRNPLRESTQQDVGYPVFGVWGFEIESVADANGNGIIEPAELVLSTEARFQGSSIPTREATVASYVKLFGDRLHLSALLQYRGGSVRFNGSAAFACMFTNSCRGVNDIDAPQEEQARAVVANQSFIRGPYMEDASYLLWRELSLGLTVPPSLARAVGAEAGQLVLGGRNLALLWQAAPVGVENAEVSADNSIQAATFAPGLTTTWLLRLHLNY